MDIFVSVGSGLSLKQEIFVKAVEDRLRAVNLTPRTVGRNTFSSDAPLKAVQTLMNDCKGVVVIALERFRFPDGIERFGSDRCEVVHEVRMPTVWNQIEASMAYNMKLPLLVIVDPALRKDGLLEIGNDWFVQELLIDPDSLNSTSFMGILESWHKKLVDSNKNKLSDGQLINPSQMTIGQLVSSLKPSHLWSVGGAFFVVISGVLAIGKAIG